MKKYYLFFALLCSVSVSFGQTLEDDRLSLVALYNATNGDDWTNKTGWNPSGAPGDNPCGWYGVTCEGGRVTELNLRKNATFGYLPVEIGNLSALEVLNLNANDPGDLQGWGGISGVIPAELGNLTNLEYLDLGGNRFTGSIPSSLGNLLNLTFLDISYKAFDFGFDPVGELGGAIPIELGNLINLKYLDLSYQNLSGNLPGELGNLTALEFMKLGGNIFEGTIPASFGNFTNLEVLDLHYFGDFVRGYGSYGALHGPIPDLSGLPTTAKVYISNHSFTFDGMDTNVSRLASYSPQALLPLSVSPAFPLPYIISVDAGGLETGYPTYSNNNTYKFFENGTLIATLVGDISGQIFVNGGATYKVEVTNSLVPGLTLYSEEVFIELGSMPVTLVSFTAKNENSNNIITWRTTSEVNNSGFEIEKSADMKKFIRIGFVDGHGSSEELQTYSITDTEVWPITYYRLKQIDHNGKFEYSRIISIKRNRSFLHLYPNPASNEFFVSDFQKNDNAVIYDLRGKVLLNQKLTSGKPISTTQLPNGIYIVTVGNETTRIVIEK
ncbi:T9SS type A sorting domain-containing protein [Dyadobacter sp. CY312]|uniref:T9SS type A sorting domain-containing protein n=1 Tax=Dyadobacter sp. CY312 TaxID=2907303 RepID=UPI001F3F57B8|nr:T9SS type A sorting domain-containing protein [Dyadobacter sp. CY312]MCE7041287.1 T9SS type A sorting domain-containing protein [Dyadobacter sp. CY312]